MGRGSSIGSDEMCQHGNIPEECTEIDCLEIHDVYISDSAKSSIEGETVQEYCVEVEYCSSRGTILHRYSAFRTLYMELVEEFGKDLVPEIPGKKFNKFSSKLVAKRMTGLNNFLIGCLHNNHLCSSHAFKCFLSPDPDVRQRFYQK